MWQIMPSILSYVIYLCSLQSTEGTLASKSIVFLIKVKYSITFSCFNHISLTFEFISGYIKDITALQYLLILVFTSLKIKFVYLIVITVLRDLLESRKGARVFDTIQLGKYFSRVILNLCLFSLGKIEDHLHLLRLAIYYFPLEYNRFPFFDKNQQK